MNTPNNAKSAASIAAIKKAFTELITDKSCAEVSVTELCKKASINRTTFYSHFSNTHEVLAALCEDLYENVVNEILPADGDIQKLISVDTNLQILSLLKENKRLYQAYFPELKKSKICQSLFEYARQKYVLSNYSGDVKWEKELEYQFEFRMQGAIGIFEKWLADDCVEDERNVAELIERMLKQSIEK